jgi:hypothetical protein
MYGSKGATVAFHKGLDITFHRCIGLFLGITWIFAMSALIQRDVLPFWLAGESPRQAFPEGKYQIAILNDAGRRVGSTWVTTSKITSLSTVHSITVLDLRSAVGLIPFANRVMLENNLSFGAEGELTEFTFILQGPGFPLVNISGERYGRDFACTAKIGSHTTTIPFDAQLSEYIGESMRPFTHLRNLHVGQSWRLRTVDPFALVKGQTLEFTSELAKVTRKETISHQGDKRDCFRIETRGATAWADASGLILRQEVSIPVLGRWTMLDEPFDPEARKVAVEQFRHEPYSPEPEEPEDL